MQLILAIDTDRRQATQLATLVRGRLAVDLVQAVSAGEGLQALGDRVPDLILTPALLSPFDDGVLAEYLRDLGSAGAHVQTLRIPVLGDVPARPSRLSFLFRRRGQAPSSSPRCDPSVFADEIDLYLARAEQARRVTAQVVAQEALESAGPAYEAPVAPPPRAEVVHEADSSEWYVDEPASSLDELRPPHAPGDETSMPVELAPLAAPPSVPSPRRTEHEVGNPSFEAALAAIRAAWDAPKSRARADEQEGDRALPPQ